MLHSNIKRKPREATRLPADQNNPQSAAIRALWKQFEPWLTGRETATQTELKRLVESAHIRPERISEVEEILKKRHLFQARREWIERIRGRGSAAYLWMITKDEKKALKKRLDWSRDEMVDADLTWENQPVEEDDHALEDLLVEEDMARVSMGDGRTKPHWSSASHSVGLKPSVARKSQAGELAGQKPKERTKWQPSSVEPPSTPLLPSKVKVHLDYVAPRFGDPDYEVLGKLGLTSFAGEICERKIIEFYEEACEATIRFHRRLPSLSRAKAPEVQERFDQGMKELADRKRREWKEMIELELKRRILEQRMTDTSHLRAAAKMKPFIPRETPGLVRTGATKKQLNRSASLPPGYHKAKEEHSKSFMDRFKKHVKFTQAAESDSDSTSDDDIPPPTPIAFRTSMSDADTGPTISFTHPDSPLLRDPKGKRRARIFF